MIFPEDCADEPKNLLDYKELSELLEEYFLLKMHLQTKITKHIKTLRQHITRRELVN